MVGPNAWNAVFNESGANVQGGKLVFDYTNDSSPASSVLSILDASHANGSNPFSVNNGAKIYSSTAEDAGDALGWADNGVDKVTVMYTFYGDATLDGQVDFDDLGVVIGNYGWAETWSGGNFNYDDQVNFDDLGFVVGNYGCRLAQPSVALGGAGEVNQGSAYILTLGEVTGVTAQSYTIDWGDGTSPQSYTEAQINASNRQVSHTFADGVLSPVITVTLTDSAGRVYWCAGGKCVAVHSPEAPVSFEPAIIEFYCINDVADIWTLTGIVVDYDDPVEGFMVMFGGVLAGYNLSATVDADGVFTLTVELHGLQEGTGTAQTFDPHGVLSDVAAIG